MDARLRCAAVKKPTMSIIAATSCHEMILGLEPSRPKSEQSLSSQVGVDVQTSCSRTVFLLVGVDVLGEPGATEEEKKEKKPRQEGKSRGGVECPSDRPRRDAEVRPQPDCHYIGSGEDEEEEQETPEVNEESFSDRMQDVDAEALWDDASRDFPC